MGDSPLRQHTTLPDRFSSHAEPMRTTWPPATDFGDVLQKAKERDPAKVGMLYRRFLPTVYRYVLARVGQVPQAEDLTSDTFMAMIRAIETTRATDELSFAAWLLGIARHQVLMHFRRCKIHPEVELRTQHDDGVETVAEEGDPLLVLLARESWAETMRALEQLTPDQRTVILYRCALGFSTDEVANMMKRRTGTIRALQFRALASLTRLLDGDGYEKQGKRERRREHAG